MFFEFFGKNNFFGPLNIEYQPSEPSDSESRFLILVENDDFERANTRRISEIFFKPKCFLKA